MKRIGILTFHRTYNYGAVLQAYALCAFLKNYDVRCIDYIEPNRKEHCSHNVFNKNKSFKENLKHFIKYYILKQNYQKEKKVGNFIEERLPLTKDQYYSFEELTNTKDAFNILISGSDQIWNPQFTGDKLDLSYLLEFSDAKTKKISYATSAGSYRFDDSEVDQLIMILKKYHAISVRENFLKKQLAQMEKKIEVVLDPTFLLDCYEWRKIATTVNIKYKYLLLYTFDNCKKSTEVSISIAKRLKLKIVSISQSLFKDKGIDKAFSDIGIQEFLWLFDNAQFVVTNSFHGTAFSIIFKKNFYSIWKKNNPYRSMNLLSSLSLQDRLIKEFPEINHHPIDIDYKISEKKLSNLTKHSRSFLKTAINSNQVL